MSFNAVAWLWQCHTSRGWPSPCTILSRTKQVLRGEDQVKNVKMVH